MTDFQRCQKRFYFAWILKVRPKAFPTSMSKGIFGHEMFEAFFKAMQEGKTYEECVEAVNDLLQDSLDNLENFSVYRHVIAFGAFAFQQEWRVVAIEASSIVPTILHTGTEPIEFAYTPDVVFQWTRGPRNGSYFMLDFKFTGQQWNDREINMYQQLPKYMIAWNKEHPDQKIFNLGVVCLLTRAANGATGDNLYSVKWLKVTREKIANIEFENGLLMARVAEAKRRWTPDQYLRSSDSFTCKMCWFADDLCPMDLEGKDLTRYIAANYEVNTYFETQYGVGEGNEMEDAAS